MKRVFFIDDDANLLSSIRRGVGGERNDWDFQFFENPKDALKEMDENTPDILVTDVQMPQINGVELMREVIGKFPQTLRVVLSSQVGTKLGLDALDLSDQFLPKPCPPTEILETLHRLAKIQDKWGHPKLREGITRDKPLPSPPEMYSRVLEKVKDPSSTIQEVAAILTQDAALSANIVHLASSAFFGMSDKRISSVEEAVSRLGTKMVLDLVLGARIFEVFDPSVFPEMPIESLWERSLQVAALSQEVAKMENLNRTQTEAAFLGGLLHVVGKILLAMYHTDSYRKAFNEAKEENVPLREKELEILGFTHCHASAYLCGIWGFPNSIVKAVGHYLNPIESEDKKCTALTCVHVGNALVMNDGSLDKDYIERVGKTESIPKWGALLGGG